MNPQRRGHQVQSRRALRQPHPTEVAMPLKLPQPARRVGILLVMPAHAHPVIQPLQRQVQASSALTSITASRPSLSTDRRSSIPRSAAANAGTCVYTCAESRCASISEISRRSSLSSHRSGCIRKRGSRLRSPIRVARRAPLKQPRHQLMQLARVLARQRSLMYARAKRNLLHTVEALARVTHAHPRKLQPVQQKGHLRAAANPLLHHCAHRLRHQRHHPRSRLGKSLPRCLFIRSVKQAASSGCRGRQHRVAPSPPSSHRTPTAPNELRLYSSREAARQSASPCRAAQSCAALDIDATAGGLRWSRGSAPAIECPWSGCRRPSTGSLPRSLRSLPTPVPMHQRSTRIRQPKALLQLHRGAESLRRPLASHRCAAQHYPLQRLQVLHSGSLARCRRAPVTGSPANPRPGPRLPKTLSR